MKCEKCGNEYPSFYYFATENICKECFNKMPLDEQAKHNILVYENMEHGEYAWRAGFGIRLGAALLDFVIYAVILMIVLFVTGIVQEYQYIFQDMLLNPELMEEFIFAIMPFVFIVSFMYYSLEIVMAATLGKMLLGLQIADEDRRAAGYEKLTIRFIFKHLDTILSLAGFLTAVTLIDTLASVASLIIIVGFFFVLAPKRQAFHDMVAKTAVFRRNDIIDEEIQGINKGINR